MGSFSQIWTGTKGFEGGYQQLVNDVANYCPAKGKPGSKLIGTKFGISAIAFGDYFHRCPGVAEMKNLDTQTAEKIAKAKFWDPVQGDKINSQPVAHLVFDATYGSGSYGPLHARRAINQVLGQGTVKEYKSFNLSDSEVSKINSIPPTTFFNTLMAIRKKFFKGLTYEQGYMNRMNQLIAMYAGILAEPEQAIVHHAKGLGIAVGIIALGVSIVIYVRHVRKKSIRKTGVNPPTAIMS